MIEATDDRFKKLEKWIRLYCPELNSLQMSLLLDKVENEIDIAYNKGYNDAPLNW